jgi:hypothetical protein
MLKMTQKLKLQNSTKLHQGHGATSPGPWHAEDGANSEGHAEKPNSKTKPRAMLKMAHSSMERLNKVKKMVQKASTTGKLDADDLADLQVWTGFCM